MRAKKSLETQNTIDLPIFIYFAFDMQCNSDGVLRTLLTLGGCTSFTLTAHTLYSISFEWIMDFAFHRSSGWTFTPTSVRRIRRFASIDGCSGCISYWHLHASTIKLYIPTSNISSQLKDKNSFSGIRAVDSRAIWYCGVAKPCIIWILYSCACTRSLVLHPICNL